MPLGPLNLLSLATRLAKPFIDRARRVGQSVRDIVTSVARVTRRVLGRPIEPPLDEVRRVIDLEQVIDERAVAIRGMPRNRVINPDDLPLSVGRQRRLFSWRVRGLIEDPVTGAFRHRFVQVATDRLLSPAEAEAAAAEFFADYGAEGEGELVNLEIVRVTRAGGLL